MKFLTKKILDKLILFIEQVYDYLYTLFSKGYYPANKTKKILFSLKKLYIIQKIKNICIYIDSKFSTFLSRYIKDDNLLKPVKILLYFDIIILFAFNLLVYINTDSFNFIFFMPYIENHILDNIINGPLGLALEYATIIKYILYLKIVTTLFLIRFYSQKNGALFKTAGLFSIVDIEVLAVIPGFFITEITPVKSIDAVASPSLTADRAIAATRPGQTFINHQTNTLTVCAEGPSIMSFIQSLAHHKGIKLPENVNNTLKNPSWLMRQGLNAMNMSESKPNPYLTSIFGGKLKCFQSVFNKDENE